MKVNIFFCLLDTLNYLLHMNRQKNIYFLLFYFYINFKVFFFFLLRIYFDLFL